MKQKVLLFFANLLAKMKQPLLPHINVYRPVHVSLVFPYKFLSKLVGIKCFYINPVVSAYVRVYFKQTLTVDLLMTFIVLRNYQLVLVIHYFPISL